MCLFISLPVYRWVFAKVNKSRNRNGLPQGERGTCEVGSEPKNLGGASVRRGGSREPVRLSARRGSMRLDQRSFTSRMMCL